MVINVYFTNITNAELQYFKRANINNFNIDLTDILSSNLFKVEEIVSNSIYRIYPLFNCETITSSNENDIILDNKCIIATKEEEESYFNFISTELGEMFRLDDLSNYKNINDTLSMEEFNGLIQLLRYNIPFKEEIKINKSDIQGLYGEYIFNLNSSTLVDDGILITDETLQSLGTVRLDNPIFKDSQYVLTLKVYHISDININNESTSNIEITTLEIPLIKYVDVEIPFETFEKDYVIGFDATVNITHNKPVIRQSNKINLYLSDYQITLGESTLLLAYYRDSNNDPIVGAEITVTSNGSVIGTQTTGNNGDISMTYTPSAANTYSLIAACGEVESSPSSLVVNKKVPVLSFSAQRRTNTSPDVDITGSLSYNNAPLANCTVVIEDGNGTVLYSPMTDSNGEFNILHDDGLLGGSYKATFNGNAEYRDVASNYIIVPSQIYDISLTEQNNKTILSYDDGDEAVLVAQCLDANNQPIVAPDIPIDFWEHSTDSPSRITTSWFLTIESGDEMSLSFMMENYGVMTITDSGVFVDNGFDTPVRVAAPIREIYYSDGMLRITDGYDNIEFYTIENFNNRFVKQSSSGTYTIEVYIGTEYTDSTGKARWYYDSEGVGDISFVGENDNISSNLLTIEDCLVYDPLTSNSGKWTIPSAVTSNYSANGWKMSSSAYSQVQFSQMISSPCRAEITVVDFNKLNAGSSIILYQYTNGSTTPNQPILVSDVSLARYQALERTISHELIKGGKYAVDYVTGTMKVYENGTEVSSNTNRVGLPTKFEIHIGAGGRFAQYKDFKLKPL